MDERKTKNEAVIVFKGALEFSGIGGFIPAPSPPWIGVVEVRVGGTFGLFIAGVVTVVFVFVTPAVLRHYKKSRFVDNPFQVYHSCPVPLLTIQWKAPIPRLVKNKQDEDEHESLDGMDQTN
ncbi:hypothetical protein E2542_SST29898 [Spatholobus suberectus]|nr:hypothetical protein E2542_SST29898 [Spatholobus suberectus]